jgi:murein DD-endopeptidase MepM/ murein hydrolase activator NlpD
MPKNVPFTKPIKNGVVTCKFGEHGTAWSCGYHTGTDYAADIGTPVYAVGDGVVVATNWGKAYGNHLVIQHGYHRFIYAHLKAKADFKPGTHIKQGVRIGLSGISGNSKGPHLHLEARVYPYRYAVDAVDPTTALK